jgi:DNA polymerase-3 subunit alpha (Gram-positive type)
MENSYVAFDLETTGLRPSIDKILEIGAVKVEDGVVTETYETFIDHGIAIPERITDLTGITEEMVAGSPSVREAVEGFLAFARDAVLLGHNVQFDYRFMKRAVLNLGGSFERKGLDTLTISRQCLPQLPAKSLDQMALHYGIPQEHHHRALDDALTTARLYDRLKEEFADGFPQLFEGAPLICKMKKESPVTNSQKVYLRDLIKYHKIDSNVKIEMLTKNEASRMIDNIILNYGKMKR